MNRRLRTLLTALLAGLAVVIGSTAPANAQLVVTPGQPFDVHGARVMCTIGLTGYGWGGEPRAITAGHCVWPDARVTVRGGPTGRVIHQVDNAAIGLDYAVIEFDRGVVMGGMSHPVPVGSTDFPLAVNGITFPGNGLEGIGTLMVKDGAKTGRQLQLQVYNDGNRVIYIGPRGLGDSGSGVRTLDGRVTAIHNHEYNNLFVVSYGTKAQAAIDDFNRFGRGGFVPVFG